MTTEVIPVQTEEERQAAAIAAGQSHTAAAQAPAVIPDAIIPDAPVKPEHVPDKFWNTETGVVNYEEWNKSHSALETKFHQGDKPNEDPAADDKTATAATGDSVVDANAEYAQHGELSDAMYTRLAAEKGLSKDMVDSYIGGLKSQAEEGNAEIYGVVGGAENYSSMIEWASESLNETEVAAFNIQIESDNPAVAQEAVKALAARYQENAPSEGTRLGGTGATTSSAMFESKVEMTAAMNAPNPNAPGKTLYETDSAYRAEVQRKMQASRKAGKNIFL